MRSRGFTFFAMSLQNVFQSVMKDLKTEEFMSTMFTPTDCREMIKYIFMLW